MTKPTRFGIGPRITLVTATYATIAAMATFVWPDACLMRFFPASMWFAAGGILIAIGVPWLAVAVTTVMRAYNRDQLATSGIFAVVRNPVYAAWIVFIGPGVMLLTRSWPLLLTPVVAYLTFRSLIHREDDYLAERFGRAYLDYRASVQELFPFPRFRHSSMAARRGVH
ncbi:MAG: isoprenylcysteine carboxylmethyltransferase family protein [Acidobacteriia bacterium]|nr:isoprenylcysteine carboxylmethyltransferase family protein [Terriglobia bacterium]